MAYGNYAPFYRGGYFNPMQTPTIPALLDNQNQFAQPYPNVMQATPAQMQTQPTPIISNDMLWVLNETEAVSFPVAVNNSVTLWDKNKDTVYIKSVNAQGVPSIRILDYTERTTDNASKTPDKHICQCGKDFVRIDVFESLQKEFEALRNELEELKKKPKTTKKAVEEVEEGE